MRMWMINPSLICLKHLRGEHVESHMWEGSIRKKIHLDGYVDSNALEIDKLEERHDNIVAELIQRSNMNHNTPSQASTLDCSYLSQKVLTAKVNKLKAYQYLLKSSMKTKSGCPQCREILYNHCIPHYHTLKLNEQNLEISIDDINDNMMHIIIDGHYINILYDNEKFIISPAVQYINHSNCDKNCHMYCLEKTQQIYIMQDDKIVFWIDPKNEILRCFYSHTLQILSGTQNINNYLKYAYGDIYDQYEKIQNRIMQFK